LVQQEITRKNKKKYPEILRGERKGLKRQKQLSAGIPSQGSYNLISIVHKTDKSCASLGHYREI
jgi:hypothetical protein